MTLDDTQLVKSLRLAYSAEKAASLAYVGHAGSLRDADEIARVQKIEKDEWGHRRDVLEIMGQYDIPVSRWNERKEHINDVSLDDPHSLENADKYYKDHMAAKRACISSSRFPSRERVREISEIRR
jgi:rubrerythrin